MTDWLDNNDLGMPNEIIELWIRIARHRSSAGLLGRHGLMESSLAGTQLHIGMD
jgi:hypothetical protein